MADTAQKTKPPANKGEQTADQNILEELTKRLDHLEDENGVLRDTVARLQPQEDAESVAKRAEREAWAQGIVDVIAGASEGPEVSRKDARTAIDVIRDAGMAKLAKRRGLEPAERTTMSEGLREHIAALGRSAEAYFEREGVGF